MAFTRFLLAERRSASRSSARGSAVKQPYGGIAYRAYAVAYVVTCAACSILGFPVAYAAGGVCSPPALGAPCATGGIAAPGASEPQLTLGLGNPIHLATGNKYQLDIDLPPNASAPGLEVLRHYNGLSTRGGALGRNWALSYDSSIEYRDGRWRVRGGDGSITPIAAPTPEASGRYWQWPDGRRLHFDAHGRLIRISVAGKVQLHIQRHSGPSAFVGLINRVEGAGDHALQFLYTEHDGDALITAVETPVGVFRYEYDRPDETNALATARLSSVQRPDGMRRTYHYEPGLQAGNAYALTGISVALPGQAALRLSTWAYDRFGRAIATQQHGRSTPAMHLEYLHSARGTTRGLTRVHSSDGQRRDVRFELGNGAYRRVDDADYDAAGRLIAAAALQMYRTPKGELASVAPHEAGWPGLMLRRLSGPLFGLSWSTHRIGQTTFLADAYGRPTQMRHANGDTVQVVYGPQGQVERIVETGGSPPRQTTTLLRWRARQLVQIEHPEETETRQYDAAGRLLHRAVERPINAMSSAVRFEERFEYDAYGRLREHRLPEGGTLHYAWRGTGSQAALAALDWEDAGGHRHSVIRSQRSEPGYQYGNGLKLITFRPTGGHTDALLVAYGDTPLWEQHRRYDAHGRVVHDRHTYPLFGHQEQLDVDYDGRSRQRAAAHRRPSGTTHHWYAWHADGALAAVKHDETTVVPNLERDASGLPVGTQRFDLRYGPNRRLEQVTNSHTGKQIASYRHNAFGHRITTHTDDDTHHFLYLHDRVVAEARVPSGDEAPVVTRRFLYASNVPVGVIEYPREGLPHWLAVHADLSGAPRLLTDMNRRPRWLASYTPTGQAKQVAGDLHFPLRLLGQYEDAGTGWHDNLLRTYAPELGQYLEPDPLGPLPGTDTFGYAGQQPWRHSDPYGLLLFAFDGTRYSADTTGNVWKLAQAYRDGAAHYHSGPGNSDFLDWDAVVAWRAGRILENQWQALLTALERQPQGVPVSIDLIGFSRGAALARHFGNRIASHVQGGVFSVTDPMRGLVSACVDLRFMGLFDSVAQFGVGGSHNHLYDFGVATLWSWVAHAVALHEHRWTMPLLSADAGGAGNVIEAPFVGVHTDIGGGVATSETSDGDDATADVAADNADSALAHVALAWMHWQARAATIDFADLVPTRALERSAALRDLRDPFWRTVQRGDRAVQAPSGTPWLAYQDDDARLGRSTREQVETFIRRVDAWRSQPEEKVGEVDMQGYSRWLGETLGWPPQEGP